MSFQETRSAISICNKALSRIMQQPLSGSLDDPANLNKHAARECSLWYKTIVRQVLSEHHWGLATKRVSLVANVTNGRAGQWAYSYIAPTDMAFPAMIGPYTAASPVVSYYKGLATILASLYGRPLFMYEAGAIYSNVEGGVLDYVSFNITEQDFNEAVEALIVIYLASQLARSVAKDHKLAKELHDEGVARQNVEIARNLNMNKPRYDHYVGDSELARGGLDIGIADLGYLR